MDTYQLSLLVWLGGLGFLLLTRSAHNPGVGLPLAYAVSLSMIHLTGGVLYLLPWHSGSVPDAVRDGFEVSTLGFLAFVVGARALAPWLVRQAWRDPSPVRGPGALATAHLSPQVAGYLPLILVGLGLLVRFALGPLAWGIPTVNALVTGLNHLVVAGVCLGVWLGMARRDRQVVRQWLLFAFTLPFLTMMQQGFLGMGTTALLTILIFYYVRKGTRWKELVALPVLAFLGLSLFVTYTRERDELREALWHREGTTHAELLEIFGNIIMDFEWFNLRDPQHLAALDRRLNQNWFVGESMHYIGAEQIQHAKGQTIVDSVILLVPRVVWPGKPRVAGGSEMVAKYTGRTFIPGTSVGVGQVLEFYINFGLPGVLVGFLVFGTLIGTIDRRAAFHLERGHYRRFLMWILPGLACLSGDRLVVITTSAVSSLASAWLVGLLVVRLRPGRPGGAATVRAGKSLQP